MPKKIRNRGRSRRDAKSAAPATPSNSATPTLSPGTVHIPVNLEVQMPQSPAGGVLSGEESAEILRDLFAEGVSGKLHLEFQGMALVLPVQIRHARPAE